MKDKNLFTEIIEIVVFKIGPIRVSYGLKLVGGEILIKFSSKKEQIEIISKMISMEDFKAGKIDVLCNDFGVRVKEGKKSIFMSNTLLKEIADDLRMDSIRQKIMNRYLTINKTAKRLKKMGIKI